jgi:hypothetical protein
MSQEKIKTDVSLDEIKKLSIYCQNHGGQAVRMIPFKEDIVWTSSGGNGTLPPRMVNPARVFFQCSLCNGVREVWTTRWRCNECGTINFQKYCNNSIHKY